MQRNKKPAHFFHRIIILSSTRVLTTNIAALCLMTMKRFPALSSSADVCSGCMLPYGGGMISLGSTVSWLAAACCGVSVATCTCSHGTWICSDMVKLAVAPLSALLQLDRQKVWPQQTRCAQTFWIRGTQKNPDFNMFTPLIGQQRHARPGSHVANPVEQACFFAITRKKLHQPWNFIGKQSFASWIENHQHQITLLVRSHGCCLCWVPFYCLILNSTECDCLTGVCACRKWAVCVCEQHRDCFCESLLICGAEIITASTPPIDSHLFTSSPVPLAMLEDIAYASFLLIVLRRWMLSPGMPRIQKCLQKKSLM